MVSHWYCMPQSGNIDRKYQTITELKGYKVNMFWKKNCLFSPRSLGESPPESSSHLRIMAWCKTCLDSLTHCGLVTPYGDRDLSQQHHAITWTNVDWSSVKSSDIHIKAISQEIPQPSVTKICLKITYLKFHSNFPGADELKKIALTSRSIAMWLGPTTTCSTTEFLMACNAAGLLAPWRLILSATSRNLKMKL